MTQTTTIKKQNKKIESIWSFFSYTFQSFFKKPFGYIVSLLYVVYLSVILLIVPATQHFDPLFIWNIGGFNIPILNLVFIAASSAAIAVSVFRISKDDGTDLVFSSKPLTKGQTVLIKTLVYVLIMLLICLLCLIITLLTKPVFGIYDIVSNPTGITLQNYKGIILSVLVGNIINMLFFGSIAALVAMVGKQVVVLISTIALSFVLLIINFLFPVISASPKNVLSSEYGSQIYSMACPTVSQYNSDNSNFNSFATISCSTDDEGHENPQYHFDTYEYWTKANQKSHSFLTNYFDIGKQLSSTYSAFGLNNAKLEEASKLSIGINSSFNYNIDKTSGVWSSESSKQYPVGIYTLTQDRGKTFPKVILLGGNMSLESDNWYLWSKLNGLDFNSVSYASTQSNNGRPSGISNDLYVSLSNKPWNRLSDLKLTSGQISVANNLYLTAQENFKEIKSEDFPKYVLDVIKSDESGLFFEKGKFNDLEFKDQFNIVSKLHLYFAVLAQQHQKQLIIDYWKSKGETATFPFKSYQINEWFKNTASDPLKLNYNFQRFFELLFTSSLRISDRTFIKEWSNDSDFAYNRLLICSVNYAETYSNMYQYSVSQFYSIWALIGIWSALSIGLFTTAIFLYKRTDFK